MLEETQVKHAIIRDEELSIWLEREGAWVNLKSVHTFTIIIHAVIAVRLPVITLHPFPLLKPTSESCVLRHGHRARHLGRALRI